MEQQFLALRNKHPDLVLFFENGYRFAFMGRDADLATKVLGIVSFWKGNFLTALVPLGRLYVHARRFIQAGYKVGIINQTETPALKAASANKNGLFKRELKAIFSKATFIGAEIDPLVQLKGTTVKTEEEDEGLDIIDVAPQFVMGHYVMCIYENPKNSKESEFGVIAIQTSTGDIIYDSFSDDFMRIELETRLCHINPVEILVPYNLSANTEKVLKNFNPHKRKEDQVAIERYEPTSVDEEHISQIEHILSCGRHQKVTKKTKGKESDSEEEQDEFHKEAEEQSKKCLDLISTFSPLLKIACVGLAQYLKKYSLESLFYLDCNYQHFTKTTYMRLDAATLKNLEIFNNSSGLFGKGTLFDAINQTQTPMGKRLLIQWVKQPLKNIEKIRERLDAVEELSTGILEQFFVVLKQSPDLERGICRVFYRKCSTIEFITILKALKEIIDIIPSEEDVNCNLLKWIFKTMPDVGTDINTFLSAMNPEAIESEQFNPVELFKDGYFENLTMAKKELAEAEAEMNKILKSIRKVLGDSTQKFVTVAKVDYLIAVKMANLKRVPNDWICCGGTKAVKRYHTPEVKEHLQTLNQAKERITIISKECWNRFLESFTEKYAKFRDFVNRLAILDCLKSGAYVAAANGYIKPTISSEPKLEIIGGRHPVLEILSSECMPNSIHLSNTKQDKTPHKTMLLTGPNMGGKSSYTRQIGLILVLAQIGYFVPAEKAVISPVDGIYTRMGAHDSETSGESTFFVELLETAHLLANATESSLVILDELGRGTSTHDGVAIAYGTLDYIISKLKSWTLFVTHYPALAQLEKKYPGQLTSHHMGYVMEDERNVTFLYKLQDGIEKRSYGLNVAQLANIPTEILERAQLLSHVFEKDVQSRQYQHYFKQLLQIIHNTDPISQRNILKDLKKDIQLITLKK
uniref:DNA mismatch repair proteins mutS family domain-containing protein n=1 Tax=Arcella intermedia TaxID=1963864 RepID=A0A6B2KX72_9EUKA